jgi:predicted HicB family RNase H-like nuclease
MTMEYKGYIGKLDIDPEADLLHGEVLGLRDVITFQGRTPAEAEKAFHESVDDYLEFCKRRAEQPEKPYSGKFMLRVDSATHRRASLQAAAAGVSLNAWISRVIAKELQAATPSVDTPARAGASRGASKKPLRVKSQPGRFRRRTPSATK